MPTLIDPRGPRFAATLTSLALALVLLTAPGSLSTALLAAQAAVFAIGAALGVQRTPYAWLFRRFLRPRLGARSRTRPRRGSRRRSGSPSHWWASSGCSPAPPRSD